MDQHNPAERQPQDDARPKERSRHDQVARRDPGSRPSGYRPESSDSGAHASTGRWRLPILRYHSVSHSRPETALPGSTSAALLKQHVVGLVAAGWRLVGITQALEILHQDNSSRVVAMTFDDGLLDFLNAFELLVELNVRATLYVPTETIGVRVSRWDRGQSKLDWAALDEMRRHGVEIGSQSVRGRPLDRCQEVEMTGEIQDSKRRLEDRLASAVTSFCYPHGYSNAGVRRAVADAGYSNACTLGSRIACSTHDELTLPRIRVRSGVTGTTIQELVCRGESGMAPRTRSIAMPAWRIVRRTTSLWPTLSHRGTGQQG